MVKIRALLPFTAVAINVGFEDPEDFEEIFCSYSKLLAGVALANLCVYYGPSGSRFWEKIHDGSQFGSNFQVAP